MLLCCCSMQMNLLPKCTGPSRARFPPNGRSSKWGIPCTEYLVPGHVGTGLRPESRVLGKPPPPPSSSSSLGKPGRHSGQETIIRGFPMFFGSWWKISENGDRGSTQNFAARLMSIVVCPGEPFLEKLIRIRKYTLFENGDVPKFQKSSFFRDKSPAGCDKT